MTSLPPLAHRLPGVEHLTDQAAYAGDLGGAARRVAPGDRGRRPPRRATWPGRLPRVGVHGARSRLSVSTFVPTFPHPLVVLTGTPAGPFSGRSDPSVWR